MSKIIKILKISLNNITYDLSAFVLCVIILSTALILLIFSSMIYNGANYSFDTLNKVLKQDVSNCGIIEFKASDSSNVDMNNYTDLLFKELNLYSIGTYSFLGTQDLTKLTELQTKTLYNDLTLSQKDYLSQNSIEVLYVNSSLLNLCELGFEDPYESYGSDSTSLYLGSKYKPFVSKGTEFTSSDLSRKYIVRGFLKENSVWLSGSVANGFNSQDTDYRVSMDCGVVCIDERPASNKIFFSSSETIDDETLDKIVSVSHDSGIKISTQSLLDLYLSEKGDLLILLEYLRQLIFVVFLSSVILISTSQIVGIIGKKRVFGIYTVTGFSRSTIYASIVLETILRLLIALIISILMGRLILLKWFGEPSLMFMRDVFWLNSVPTGFATSLVLTAVSTIISLIVLSKYTPIELLGEKND